MERKERWVTEALSIPFVLIFCRPSTQSTPVFSKKPLTKTNPRLWKGSPTLKRATGPVEEGGSSCSS